MEAVMADAMDKQATDTQPAVLVAIELSRAGWLLAVYDPTTEKISRRRIAGGDAAGLIAVIGEARRRAEHRAGGPIGAECVFEAGYDGFWLHRRLMAAGIGCRVMDPASLKVDRRARRVKTDRVDAESLLRALQAWRRGDHHACRFVRVPEVAEEDARRPHRELNRLKKERVGHVNRIKGLLALHGVRDYQPLRQDRRPALAVLRAWDGAPLPPHRRREVERELVRLELVLEQIAEVEDSLATSTAAAAGTEDAVIALEALVCVGRETAVVLVRELFCRGFGDRRSLAAFTGLAPSPYSSGRLYHEQGISKAGNPIVRARLVQLAWRWVRFQPGSAITAWFRAKTAGGGGRAKRVAIVAVARKLAIALWRMATLGIVPEGAKLRPAVAAAG
jgi:transposase